jgi:hypothetical protein
VQSAVVVSLSIGEAWYNSRLYGCDTTGAERRRGILINWRSWYNSRLYGYYTMNQGVTAAFVMKKYK